MSKEAKQIDTDNWDEVGVNVDGHYKPEVSGRLVGRVLEHFQMPSMNDTMQDAVKVRVAEPITAVLAEDETKELAVGDVIAVRISATLTPLLDCVTNQCAVMLEPIEKAKRKGGKTMWRYTIKTKGLRVPLTRTERRPAQTAGDADDGDLPF